MRRLLMAGNWKMNLTAPESQALAGALRKDLERDAARLGRDRDVMVAPPAINIPAVARELFGSAIALGAQNMHCADRGAFTGEISAPMLKEFGVVYVILGHSERRHIFGEDDKLINLKLLTALRHGLTPILCVGETAQEHDRGATLAVVLAQLQHGLDQVSAHEMSRVAIAYEPVWAIGTGRNATPQQAGMVHSAIREALGDHHGTAVAATVRVLYGGSVTADNVDSLVAHPDIDGALVGGASLKVEAFARIVRAAV
jgi:triosephosphate isomerase (TIM)